MRHKDWTKCDNCGQSYKSMRTYEGKEYCYKCYSHTDNMIFGFSDRFLNERCLDKLKMKRLGRICLTCDKKFIPTGKFCRHCEECISKKRKQAPYKRRKKK